MIMKTFEEKCRLLNYELYLLHTISKSIKETVEENRILSVTLTGLTANVALGLSRAAVFYYDRDKSIIFGKQGIGPYNEEEAFRIWDDLGQNLISLETYLEYDIENLLKDQQFPESIRNIVVDFDNLKSDNYFKRTIKEKKFFHIKKGYCPGLFPEELSDILKNSDIVILPLTSPRGVKGIVMADNAFHLKPVEESTLLLISLIAVQAGLALENASNISIMRKQIEELKELKTTMEHMQEEILKKEKLSTVGKMASYFVHEIRNPLVTIGGFAKHIKDSDNLDTIQRDAGIIYREIQKLEQILGKISGFTYLSPSKTEKVNLLETVNETVEFFELELAKKNICLSVKIPPNLRVKAEKVQLTEIFFNIISNSIESMKGGQIRIFAEINPPFAEIVIKDQGKGIPENNIAKVTEPFFSTKQEGFGFGLYIVKNIIENTDGSMDITSVEGEGTEVKIKLPI